MNNRTKNMFMQARTKESSLIFVQIDVAPLINELVELHTFVKRKLVQKFGKFSTTLKQFLIFPKRGQ